MEDGERFVQSDAVRDTIFPFFTVSQNTGRLNIDSFEGTGFLIGQRGLALTAGHVARVLRAGSAVAGFVGPSGGWFVFDVLASELHSTEDIAVVQLGGLPGQTWKSWLQPCVRWEGASRGYGLWGYPVDIYHEVVTDGIAIGRPDLIFSQGHIRRRMSNVVLDGIHGKNFFELSAIAGGGCSGSPIVVWPPPGPGRHWEVIGVYCGQRVSLTDPISVGYAVRMDAVQDWIPTLLGSRIGDVAEL